MDSFAVNVRTLPESKTLPRSPVSDARAPDPLIATTRFTPFDSIATSRVTIDAFPSNEVAVTTTDHRPVVSSSGVVNEPSWPMVAVTGVTGGPGAAEPDGPMLGGG